MKKAILIIAVLQNFYFLSGQNQGIITGKYYQTIIDIPVTEYNLLNEKSTDIKYISKRGQKFAAYEVKDSFLVIKFWEFRDTTNLSCKKKIMIRNSSELDPKKIGFNTNDKYFLVRLTDFNMKTRDFYGSGVSFVWGFSVLPFKTRLGNQNRDFIFETGFQLGSNVGCEYQFRSKIKHSIGMLAGVGISTIAVSPETTNNYIDVSNTVGALTPSLGAVYSYENYQLGLFVGFDIMGGEMGKNWQYTGSPWLGFGLGFSIFQKNKSEERVKQGQGSK